MIPYYDNILKGICLYLFYLSSHLFHCTFINWYTSFKTFFFLSFHRKIIKGHKVIEESKIPNKCIAEVSGKLVFQEENDRVYPLIDFPEDKINDMSRKLINSHKEQLKNARIIMQVRNLTSFVNKFYCPCYMKLTL